MQTAVLNPRHPSSESFAHTIEITPWDTQKLQYWILERPKFEPPTITLNTTTISSVHPGRTRFLYSVITQTPILVYIQILKTHRHSGIVYDLKPTSKTPRTTMTWDWHKYIQNNYAPIPLHTIRDWRKHLHLLAPL